MEAKFGPLEKKDKKRLASIEMKIFRGTAATTVLATKEMKILEDPKVKPVNEKLKIYKSKWLGHVTIMNSSSMAKIVLNCRPSG